MFFFEISEKCKNTYFEEHLRMTASESCLEESVFYFLALSEPKITSSHEGLVLSGTTIEMNCTNDDAAKPTLTWFNKDGIVVSRTNLLKLENIQRKHTNEYRCRAKKEREEVFSRYVNIKVACK